MITCLSMYRRNFNKFYLSRTNQNIFTVLEFILLCQFHTKWSLFRAPPKWKKVLDISEFSYLKYARRLQRIYRTYIRLRTWISSSRKIRKTQYVINIILTYSNFQAIVRISPKNISSWKEMETRQRHSISHFSHTLSYSPFSYLTYYSKKISFQDFFICRNLKLILSLLPLLLFILNSISLLCYQSPPTIIFWNHHHNKGQLSM